MGAAPWEKYQTAQPTPAGSAAPWEKYTKAPAKPQASTFEIIRQAPGRAVAGVAEGIAQTPENILNLAKMAYGTGVTAAGFPGMAPSVESPPQRIIPVLEQFGILPPLGEMTPEQKVLNVGLQSGLAGLVSPAAGVKEALSTGFKGALGGAAGETVTQQTGNELLGLATTLATPGLATKAAQSRQASLQAQAPKLNALAEARAAGYKVVPSDIEPTMGRRLVEGISSREALESSLAAKNQKVTDRLARQALGLTKSDPLDENTLKKLRTEAYETGYKPIEQAGRINADVDYLLELNDVGRKYGSVTPSFPKAAKDEVEKIIKAHRVNGFEGRDALKRISDLRADATAAFKRDENDLGSAMRGVADALENQLERHLDVNNAGAVDRFRQARIQMAKTHAVEAAMKRGEGSVDATKLANLFQRKAPLTDELATIAKSANAFGNAFRQPGKAKAAAGSGTPVSSVLGGLFGASAGNLPGAIAGALAPGLVRGGARAYLGTPLGQRSATVGIKNVLSELSGERISDPLVLNALLASIAANRSE